MIARTSLRRLLPGLLATTCLACADILPTAPSDLVEGIVVYEHAFFQGDSAHITKDIADLGRVKGPCQKVEGQAIVHRWDDCVSSVRIAPGWEATLYRDDSYQDDSVVITEDVANLESINHNCRAGGLNDCVTSIRVRRR